METDTLFAKKRPTVSDFRFDLETVRVFDDMINRSVPFYAEIQRMIVELAADFAVENTNVYDLGCSTGTTLAALDAALPRSVRFVGIDNAPEMLHNARDKFAGLPGPRACDFRLADLHRDLGVENASVALLILTLQFIRPLYRGRFIREIARGLHDNGCLILVEKVTTSDSTLNRLFIKHYHAGKRRNGYTDMEIAQKREALENVLIPFRMEENRALLLGEGFRSCEEFFRWYNFVGFIAVR